MLRLYLTAPDSRKSLEANVEDFVKKLSELDVNGQAAMLEMFEQMSIEKPEVNTQLPVCRILYRKIQYSTPTDILYNT